MDSKSTQQEETKSSNPFKQLCLNRELYDYVKDVSNKVGFSVLYWNILNSDKCTKERFDFASEKALNRENRLQLIYREIKLLHPDFICFSEVTQADYQEIAKNCQDQKYKFLYTQRLDKRDGLLIGFKSTKFDLKQALDGEYMDILTNESYPQVYQICIFVATFDKNVKFELVLGLTNFRSQGLDGAQTRLYQAQQFSSAYLELLAAEEKKYKKKERRVVGVVAGSLNDEIFSEPIKIMKKDLKLQSCYDMLDFTKLKKSGETLLAKLADYLMATANVQPCKIFRNIEDTGEAQQGLPHESNPSDHLSLYAKFIIQKTWVELT